MNDLPQGKQALRYAGRIEMDFRGKATLVDHPQHLALDDLLREGSYYATIDVIAMEGVTYFDLASTEAFRLLCSLLGMDDVAAKEWLLTPAMALGGRLPVELLSTEAGRKEVETMIRRIDANLT